MILENGSPVKSTNSYLKRYIETLGSEPNVQSTSSQVLSLTPVTSSKINSKTSSLKILSTKPNSHLQSGENKENNLTSNPVRNTPKPRNKSLSIQNIVIAPNEIMKTQSGKSGTKTEKSKFDSSIFSPEDAKYYEFLCRVAEAKKWIEKIINEELPSALELVTGNSMRDGVYLAKVTEKIKPELVKKIIPSGDHLEFKHSQNINVFFSLVQYVGVPELFTFVLTDLYEKKDIPKVFETIHALANIINKNYTGEVPEIENLSDQIEFTLEEIGICKKCLPGIRNFRSFKSNFSPSPAPIKQNTEGLLKERNLDTPITKNIPTSYSIQELSTPDNQLQTLEDISDKQISEVSLPSVSNPQEDMETMPYSSYSIFRDSFSKTPHLEYTPSKSFSHYLPFISRHVTRKSNFFDSYIKRRYENDYDYDYSSKYYQTLRYDASSYSPLRNRRMAENRFLDTVSHIQAIVKGVNVRYKLYLQKRTLELFTNNIIAFQAKVRSKNAKYFMSDHKELYKESINLSSLQFIIRGFLQRERIDKIRFKCLKNESRIILLQSICKSILNRAKVKDMLDAVVISRHPLTNFQSYLKGKLERQMIEKINVNLECQMDSLLKFQSYFRGFKLRTKIIKLLLPYENSHNHSLFKFQSLSRGMIQRRILSKLLSSLHLHNECLSIFSCYLKGRQIRQNLSMITHINMNDPVVNFQAHVKGVLTRFTIELLTDLIEYNHFHYFQSHAHALLIRREIKNLKRHYKLNQRSVIEIQSKIRMYQIRSAYIELMLSASPRLWSVRKFVHVLNGNQNHKLYNKLHSTKMSINTCNDQIRKSQVNIRNLAIKKYLLEKRDIYISQYISSQGLKTLETFTVNKTTTKTREQSALYEQICYLLQVDPFYWKVMFKTQPNFCLTYIPKIYSPISCVIGERENLLFIKMISDLMLSEIEDHTNVHYFFECTDPNIPWKRVLEEYLCRHQTKSISETLTNVINFLNNPDMDVKSIPSSIYQSLHPHEPKVPSNIAIDDPDTKNKFIDNMTSIWTAIELVFISLSENSNKIPIELKYLCTKAFKAIADKTEDESDSLKAVGKLVIEHFINFGLKNYEKYGFINECGTLKRKIDVISDSLSTIFSFRRFEGYYSPLNQYLEQVEDNVTNMLRNMLILPEFEKKCDNITYRDMGSSDRAILAMKHQYLIDMLKVFVSSKYLFPHDDCIIGLLDKIEVFLEKSTIDTRGVISIELDSTSYHVPLEDDRSTLMYNETKNGLAYIMQVEDVSSNLTDLLTSIVMPEDGPTFEKLLTNYPEAKKDLVQKNLGTLDYPRFKKHIMQRVKELSELGIIDKTNNYQSILNDISNTIKSNSYIRTMNGHELEFMESVLSHLTQKKTSLQLLSEALDAAILKSLKSLQKSRVYTPLKKNSFGHKLKDAYKKVQNKAQYEPSGASHVWTTRYLYEKGVLIDIKGENLKEIPLSFFGASGPKFPDIDFRISTQNGEVFGLEMIDNRKRGGDRSTANFKLTELLDKESIDVNSQITLFQTKTALLSVTSLMDLVIETFLK